MDSDSIMDLLILAGFDLELLPLEVGRRGTGNLLDMIPDLEPESGKARGPFDVIDSIFDLESGAQGDEKCVCGHGECSPPATISPMCYDCYTCWGLIHGARKRMGLVA